MLEIFPASSLDNSILTPVLVGLFVVWFFQETLGWNFSGLIVPGYLASVLVVQPLTGLVITIECVATWGLVWLVSEVVPVTWYWSRLFGRDRFFAVCLASVVIRLLLEGGGLQLLQAWTGSEPSAVLHSMGLLVVPLGANALWRSGLVAGVPRLGIPVAITWAILEFGLIRFTNLSLASFELTYEQVALDFVSAAAEDQNIDIATRVFDVEDASTALPPGDLVVLADVFVTDPVSEACAARCEEALKRGSDVLVVAAERSTRDAFLRALGRGSFGPAPARLDGGEAGLWLVDGGAG